MNPIFYHDVTNSNKQWFSNIDPSVDFKGTAKIGENVIIEKRCIIGHQVFIGHHTVITENTVIEDYACIGPNVIIESIQDIIWQRDYIIDKSPTYIKAGARIMASTTLMPGIAIGYNSFIGTGSLVTRSIPNGEIWYGHPARKRGLVDPDDIPIGILEGISLTYPS